MNYNWEKLVQSPLQRESALMAIRALQECELKTNPQEGTEYLDIRFCLLFFNLCEMFVIIILLWNTMKARPNISWFVRQLSDTELVFFVCFLFVLALSPVLSHPALTHTGKILLEIVIKLPTLKPE